jgi:hypothetical protein
MPYRIIETVKYYHILLIQQQSNGNMSYLLVFSFERCRSLFYYNKPLKQKTTVIFTCVCIVCKLQPVVTILGGNGMSDYELV